MRMNRLVSDRVIIQTLHHIYLASRRPFGIFGQHPDSRPGTFCGIQPGTDLDPSVRKSLFTFGINRLRILRLIENLTLGTAAVGYRTESMHGAGSPQAQRIMIQRQGNIGMKKKLAKAIAKIDD